MKSIISKIAITAIAAICLNLNVQATPVNDTSKMKKAGKRDKMASKMSHAPKMAKDSGKMSKI